MTSFGAIPDGRTLATRSFQAAMDALGEKGGGTVIVPAGRYLTGAIVMRSNITLHLEAGATLVGSNRYEDFPLWRSEWEGPGPDGQPGRMPLLGGEGLRNIAVTGRGTIDGGGAWWWEHRECSTPRNVRPTLIRFVDCQNIRIEGITCTMSPSWTITPLACENVTITGVTVLNPPDSPNTDGINPDSCRNVRISDCHVDVGDDCITIKSGKETDRRRECRACENITITNCTLVHGHGGVVVGSEITGSVRNVTISNCVFVGTDRGIRIKARRGRGGVVEDIRAANLVMDGVWCPIVVNLFYGCGAWGERKVTDTTPQPVDSGTPRFRRFRYSQITAKNIKFAAAYVLGLPERYVEDVAITDCEFLMDRNNTEWGEPAMASVVGKHCRSGIIARWTDRLRVRNVVVADQLGPAIAVHESRGVTIEGAELRAPPTDSEAIVLDGVEGGVVR